MEQISAGLAIGFLASMHCILMCGPLAHALPVGSFSPQKVRTLRLIFIAGRWSVYAFMGLLVGGIQMPVSWLGIQDFFLWIAVLVLFGVVTWWERDYFLKFRQRLQSWSRSIIKSNPTGSFWVLGMANGLLPCGAVYAALALAAISGSPLFGALTMVAFGFANSWWHLFLLFKIRIPAFSLGAFSFLKSQRVSMAIVVLALVFRLVHTSDSSHKNMPESLNSSTSTGVCQKPGIQFNP